MFMAALFTITKNRNNQMSAGGVDKLSVIQPCSGILFVNIKRNEVLEKKNNRKNQ